MNLLALLKFEPGHDACEISHVAAGPHGKRGRQCIDCAKEESEAGITPLKGCICIHLKRRSRCKICGGYELCVHGRTKKGCRKCKGVVPNPLNGNTNVTIENGVSISMTLEEIFQMNPKNGGRETSSPPLSGHNFVAIPQINSLGECSPLVSWFQGLQTICPTFGNAAKSSPNHCNKKAKAPRTQSKSQSITISKRKLNSQAQKKVKVPIEEKLPKKGSSQFKKRRQQSCFGCDKFQFEISDAPIKVDTTLGGTTQDGTTQAKEWVPVYQKSSECRKNRRTAKDSLQMSIAKIKAPANQITAILEPRQAQHDSMPAVAHAVRSRPETLENRHFQDFRQISIWSCETSFEFKTSPLELASVFEAGALPMSQHEFSMNESLDLHFIDHWQEWMSKIRQDDFTIWS